MARRYKALDDLMTGTSSGVHLVARSRLVAHKPVDTDSITHSVAVASTPADADTAKAAAEQPLLSSSQRMFASHVEYPLPVVSGGGRAVQADPGLKAPPGIKVLIALLKGYQCLQT